MDIVNESHKAFHKTLHVTSLPALFIMKQQCVGLLLVCDDLTQSARSLVAYIHVPMARYSVMEEVKFFVLQCGNEIVNYYVIVPCREVVLFSEVCF